MAQVAQLTLYSSSALANASAALNAIIHILAPSRILHASLEPEANTWQAFMEGREADVEMRIVARNALPESASDWLGRSAVIRYCLLCEEACQRLNASIARQAANDALGDYHITNVYLTIGPHDIFECEEHPEGHRYGRATLSVQFYGVPWPHNVERARSAILEASAVRDLATQVGAVVPDLNRCFYLE